MYLFNTDIITNIFKPRPAEGLLERLASVEQRKQFISTITISEIVYAAPLLGFPWSRTIRRFWPHLGQCFPDRESGQDTQYIK
jgi:predicted nucleic acid-binding protein